MILYENGSKALIFGFKSDKVWLSPLTLHTGSIIKQMLPQHNVLLFASLNMQTDKKILLYWQLRHTHTHLVTRVDDEKHSNRKEIDLLLS